MKIGLFQLDTCFNKLEQNKAHIEATVASSDADLFIAPELWNTGYTLPDIRKNAENAPRIIEWTASLAKKHNRTFVLGSIGELIDNDLYNSLYCIGADGTVMSKYSKIHLFTLTKEDDHFSAGRTVVTQKIDDLTFGFAICYDLRFPELFRLLREKGADAVILPANWPAPRVAHWLTLGKARAIENQMYMIGVNRSGIDNGIEFGGSSFVYAPWGETVLENPIEPNYTECEITRETVEYSRSRFDSFRDRVPQLYSKEGL